MEMNKNNTHIPVSGGVKHVAEKPKSLTPAVLGMPNSHGVKFSASMTSEDKKHLLMRLEEWREARKQKLAASILAKQKQVDKPKAPLPPLPLKSKPVPLGGIGNSKPQIRQSVFERLYQNNGKLKKQEVAANCNRPQQTQRANIQKSGLLPLDKSKKPERVLITQKNENLCKISESNSVIKSEEGSLSHVVDSGKSGDVNSIDDTANSKKETGENCSAEVSKETSFERIKVTKPVHPLGEEIKVLDEKSLKSNPALGSLPVKTVEDGKDKKLRRSISMVYRQKRRTETAMRRSVSVKNLQQMHLKTQNTDNRSLHTLQHNWDTKKETENEAVAKLAAYTTPKSTKSSTSSSLRSKLEDWLKVNGHPLEGYRHLRCFGIKDNAKPLPEVPNVASQDEAFENSYYATAPNTPAAEENKENVTPPTVVQQVDVRDVENWLKELHRLIVELKYPSERCEEWLSAIRKKCTSCSQMPIYWECLAALNESKGDLKSAIEDYERVIIKGGQVDTVGESLAQLFDKMVIEQEKRSKAKLDKGLDPKNIFKSTIIKFALQQKAVKKLSSEIEPSIRQQLYIATPVRRSTRLQTPLKSTDEVASLQTLTPEFRKNVTFKPNESLLSGD